MRRGLAAVHEEAEIFTEEKYIARFPGIATGEYLLVAEEGFWTLRGIVSSMMGTSRSFELPVTSALIGRKRLQKNACTSLN